MQSKSFDNQTATPSLASLDILSASSLALYVLVTRLLCRGSVYFSDGPSHVDAILTRTYIIQPPGYWLFNRIAGLFPTPELTISALNILFSVAGILVFYFTALLFTSRRNAFLGAFVYANISYIWFSGEIHSTYASQILFPVAVFYTLVRYERSRQRWLLYLAAALFALGAGLRPSDGAFLIPMVGYFAVSRLGWKDTLRLSALVCALCLCWIVPTWLAYRESQDGIMGAFNYVNEIVRVKSLLSGINKYSLANVVRYVLPLFIAFWPLPFTALTNIVRNRDQWHIRMLLFWIVPGSLFLTLVLTAHATYLNFFTAAIVLLGLNAPRRMLLTAASNIVVFLAFVPIPSHKLVVNVWNCDIGSYTLYAIRNQWQPNLSTVQANQ